MLLVLDIVHQDARAVDDELADRLGGDLGRAEVLHGISRDDFAGIRDVELAVFRRLPVDELLPSPEAELVDMERSAVEAGRSARHCRAVRPSLRGGSPCLGLDIYDI